jgi:hypothetical protein
MTVATFSLNGPTIARLRRVGFVVAGATAIGGGVALGDLAYRLVDLSYGVDRLRDRPPDAPVRLPANPLPDPDLAGAVRHEVALQGGATAASSRVSRSGAPGFRTASCPHRRTTPRGTLGTTPTRCSSPSPRRAWRSMRRLAMPATCPRLAAC